jgi:hypothetical protein
MLLISDLLSIYNTGKPKELLAPEDRSDPGSDLLLWPDSTRTLESST